MTGDGVSSLLQTLRRRRQLALITAVSVSASLGLWSLGQRLFHPVYEGRFEMQIANPLEPGRNGGTAGTGGGGGNWGGDTGGVVEAIARSGSGTNLANMVRLLGSPLVIGAVADAQAVPLEAVIQGLSISLPGEGVNQVLAVSLRWPNPDKGEQILAALAKRYVAFSQEQRQQALDSGMRFLDQQAPDLLGRVDALQDQLRALRVRNGFLDPLSQSQTLQQSRDNLTGELRNLQLRQAQLDSQIRAVQAGRLVLQASGSPGADQLLGPGGLATAPRRSPQDSAAAAAGTSTPLAELQQIEKELATARASYLDSTPLVRSLLARRAQLRPVVQRQTLDGLRSALLVNSAQQDELNRQILLLDLVFSVDSIITAVGMTAQVPIMVAAVLAAVAAMLLAADPLARFIRLNPTVVMLALGFLLMIGMTLIAEGFGAHVPKGYIYGAMAFSAFVEGLNILARRKSQP
jgi:hypothetical protein